MKTATDQDMTFLTQIVFGKVLPVEHVARGLFNRVFKQASGGSSVSEAVCRSSGFRQVPTLPTNADQRCKVAAAWHKLALKATSSTPDLTVPKLLSAHDNLQLLVMEEVQGFLLYDRLVVSDISPSGVAPSLIRWMAALHSLDAQPRAELLAASTPFKVFKVDLQYLQLIEFMPKTAVLHAKFL